MLRLIERHQPDGAKMTSGVVTIPFEGNCATCAPGLDAQNGATGVDAFLAGPENCLVEPAVRHVLHRRPATFNPLVIYGSSGTGKSHLALGLADAWKTHYPGQRVEYVTASDFARQLTDAIEAQAVEDLRTQYRGAALLVVENLGELLGKQAAQEELLYTLDALLCAGGQLVVTAAVAPAELPGLSPALVSRLSAGLSMPLAPPGVATRLALLHRLANWRQIELAPPIARLLAEGLDGTVPDLLAALIQLEVTAREQGRSLDAGAVRAYLAERNTSQQPELRKIAAVTARYFSLKIGDLRGPARRRPVVTARDIAMYLARLLTHSSLQHIGRYFGGRDHTTVLHGCRKTEALVKSDPSAQKAVIHLKKKLQ
jgi:chromosomal replication initiator protein